MAGAETDLEAILALQEAHARAVLERGDLPDEIVEKFVRYCEITELHEAKKASPFELRERIELAMELLPHLYFKLDDVNWSPQ